MPLPHRDVEASLLRKGFRQREDDHSYFVYYHMDGLKSRFSAKTSHGRAEISDSLLRIMAKQVGLTNKDFLDLVDCPLSREAYEAKATVRR